MTHQNENAVQCLQCELSEVCREQGKDDDNASLGTVPPQSNIQKGEPVCREGESFNNLYAVNEGALKSEAALSGGESRVTGFYFAGEIVGSEAVSMGEYGRTVVALQDSKVCAIPESSFSLEDKSHGNIYQGLLLAMSHQVRNEQWTVLMAAHRSEQRVALFLFMVSKRLEFHGFSADEFRLPMTRRDIASYLGLAIETVSRSFQRLKSAGVIEVSGRNVALKNRDLLLSVTERLPVPG